MGFNRTATLQCIFTGDDETKPIQWWREGNRIDLEKPADENEERMKYTASKENNTLTIIYVGKQYGQYQLVQLSSKADVCYTYITIYLSKQGQSTVNFTSGKLTWL